MMHVMKNLCMNLLGLLGVYGKTKDTKEAWQDNQHVKDSEGRHPEWFQGRASYALTKEENVTFFECLNSIKVLSGFSSNIKGILNMVKKKFQNLKSHDYFVILESWSLVDIIPCLAAIILCIICVYLCISVVLYLYFFAAIIIFAGG
jgi:hypothetical protein